MAKKQPKNKIEQVQELIPYGSDHPITAKQISKLTAIPLRGVYGIVRYLLVHGNVPIGALRDDDKHGYFIITSEEERQATLAPLCSHAKEIEERISCIKTVEIG